MPAPATNAMHRFCPHGLAKAWVVVAMVVFGLTACTKSVAPTPSQEPQPKIYKRVVVLPFIDLARILGTDTSVRGPITRQVFITDEIAPQGELFMTKTLRRLLQADPEVQWITSMAQDLNFLSQPNSRKELIRSLQKVGRQYNADGLLVSYLYAFRDRQGGALGAELPAYVAFEIVLVSVGAGRLVWQQKFAETQEPLNENLFKLGTFIKRKGRWVTAREMATQALKDILETYPKPASISETE